jgi:hypothetical protein
MRQCRITDTVYSKFTRGFETYQQKTGKRHPLQPDVVSAGTKRDVIKEDLVGGPGQYWTGMCAILCDLLCLTIAWQVVSQWGHHR